jgi:hypothetical protein
VVLWFRVEGFGERGGSRLMMEQRQQTALLHESIQVLRVKGLGGKGKAAGW